MDEKRGSLCLFCSSAILSWGMDVLVLNQELRNTRGFARSGCMEHRHRSRKESWRYVFGP
jgi:hypothetical protein